MCGNKGANQNMPEILLNIIILANYKVVRANLLANCFYSDMKVCRDGSISVLLSL